MGLFSQVTLKSNTVSKANCVRVKFTEILRIDWPELHFLIRSIIGFPKGIFPGTSSRLIVLCSCSCLFLHSSLTLFVKSLDSTITVLIKPCCCMLKQERVSNLNFCSFASSFSSTLLNNVFLSSSRLTLLASSSFPFFLGLSLPANETVFFIAGIPSKGFAL